nr:hypothetical protein [Tanacetum cinerariifolium]
REDYLKRVMYYALRFRRSTSLVIPSLARVTMGCVLLGRTCLVMVDIECDWPVGPVGACIVCLVGLVKKVVVAIGLALVDQGSGEGLRVGLFGQNKEGGGFCVVGWAVERCRIMVGLSM